MAVVRIIFTGLLLLASACSRPPTLHVVQERDRFLDVRASTRIDQVIRLEGDRLALGVIKKLVRTPNGDLYASDSGIGGFVYRFDSTGRHIRTYGESLVAGQPRTQVIIDFDVTSDGVVVVTQHELLRLDLTTGAVTARASLQPIPVAVAQRRDRLCVLQTTLGLSCFSSGLKQVRTVRLFETDKLADYIHLSSRPMVFLNDSIIAVSQFYSPAIAMVGLESGSVDLVGVVGSADGFAALSLWDELDVRSASAQAEIRLRTRRFGKLFARADGSMLLVDTRLQDSTKDLVHLNVNDGWALRGGLRVLDMLPPVTRVPFNPIAMATGGDPELLLGSVPNDDAADTIGSAFPTVRGCKGAWQCVYFLRLDLR